MSRWVKFWRWVGSADCELIHSVSESDCGARCYRSRSTGRYLILTSAGGGISVWLATTENGARNAVYHDSEHPYTRVRAPERLREVRALNPHKPEGWDAAEIWAWLGGVR